MRIKKHVENLEYLSNEERGEYVIGFLKSAGIKTTIEEYEESGSRHRNIIGEMGGPEEYETLATAHFDRSEESPGANDNASGIATLLATLEELRDYDFRGKVRFVFFDCEEIGLKGSKHFVSSNKLDNIKGAINVEVCGDGGVLHIGTHYFMDKAVKYDKNLNEAVKKTSEKLGYDYAELPTPPSDHLNFLARGVPSTCLSCLPENEIEDARDFMDGTGAEPPGVWKRLGTAQDRSTYVKEGSLRMMVDVLSDTIISLDNGPTIKTTKVNKQYP